ncbi:MAG TPA: GntR family transcriptional regulator [Streptosporangiaceae bacterium]|nr:GntR family transcriptional regulator [Streptosporangiaceae bacterium]
MRPDEIAELLRRAVRTRILLPGQPLNQDELAQRFGVSRIPLREALRTLAGEGLVIMRPGIGAVVTELNADEVNELYGLRMQLEPPLAEWIVARQRAQDVTELEGILARMSASEPGDLDGWANQHYLFHRRMVELSSRRHSLRLVTQVLNLVEPYSRLYVHLVGPEKHSVAEHQEIIDAMRAGDAQGLAARMTQGLEVVRKQLVASMAGDDQHDDLAALFGAAEQQT